jgi:hypothetical protein
MVAHLITFACLLLAATAAPVQPPPALRKSLAVKHKLDAHTQPGKKPAARGMPLHPGFWSDVRASDARKNIEAKQVYNRTLLTKRSDDCETAKIYKGSGTTWLGKYASASQCAAGCAEKAFTGYTFWPECGKEGGCGCRCATASATLEDTDDPAISGDLDCDTCSYTCSNCATCSKVDRMDTTYNGLAGGTITWNLVTPYEWTSNYYNGFCFTPQQNDKAIEVAFVTGDGDEVGLKSLSDVSYEASSKICYVTKTWSSGYRFKVNLYIDGVLMSTANPDYATQSHALGNLAVTFLLRFVDEGAAASDIESHRYRDTKTCCDDSTKTA